MFRLCWFSFLGFVIFVGVLLGCKFQNCDYTISPEGNIEGDCSLANGFTLSLLPNTLPDDASVEELSSKGLTNEYWYKCLDTALYKYVYYPEGVYHLYFFEPTAGFGWIAMGKGEGKGGPFSIFPEALLSNRWYALSGLAGGYRTVYFLISEDREHVHQVDYNWPTNF